MTAKKAKDATAAITTGDLRLNPAAFPITSPSFSLRRNDHLVPVGGEPPPDDARTYPDPLPRPAVL
jgi:hypothetical protein